MRPWYLRGVGPDSWATAHAVRAAAWLRDAGTARELHGVIGRQRGRVAEAGMREAESVVAILEGKPQDGIAGFIDAIRRWRDLGFEFDAAMCALSLVSMVGPTEPEARAAGEWAAAVFERVGAEPFGRRLAVAMLATAPPPAARNEERVKDSEASPTLVE